MPTCLRNWKAIARGYGSKLFSHEDFCCPKCTHMKPGLLLIKIVDETRDLFWAVVSRRFPEGSCAEGKHSNSVSARQCASTLDRHTGSGMAGGKKRKQGMQENTCNRLWECLDISSGIRKRKKKEGRNEKGKKEAGFLNCNRHHKQRHSMMHEELFIWYFLCDPHQWLSSGELLLLPLYGLIADDVLAADQSTRKTDQGGATASGY